MRRVDLEVRWEKRALENAYDRKVVFRHVWKNPNEPSPYSDMVMGEDEAKELADRIYLALESNQCAPCPFCGGPAVVMTRQVRETGGPNYYEVCCQHCTASIRESTMQGARDSWNRRDGKSHVYDIGGEDDGRYDAENE